METNRESALSLWHTDKKRNKHISGLRAQMFSSCKRGWRPSSVCNCVYLQCMCACQIQMCQIQQLPRNNSFIWNTHHSPHICPSISPLSHRPGPANVERPSMCRFRAPETHRKINKWASCQPDNQTTASSRSLSSQRPRTCSHGRTRQTGRKRKQRFDWRESKLYFPSQGEQKH